MSQTNLNDSHVLNNNGFNVVAGGGNDQPSPSSNNVATSSAGVATVLSNTVSRNANGTDFSTENGDYEVATALSSGKFLDGTASTLKVSNVLGNYVNNVEFLPSEQVAKTEWNAATVTAGSYLDGTTWKAPTLSGNASAFTLSTTDTGRAVTLTETISGAPFTTGNGAVNDAFTFRGANNDTLAIKHSVNVANVPALTNNNGGSALDVRNESYGETYAKQGVTSNYAWNSAHKYTEVSGNQSLNDAYAQTYAYKDAGLTINSSVKTTVADAAYINGAENIAESRSGNYSYKAASGSVDYIITDTRNLAQVDQRSWTNTTVTNVAKFEVKDAVNGTTISAKGLITGTTDNVSTAKAAAVPTTFKATNAAFTVDSAHYSLVVDPKEFNTDHVNTIDNGANALLALVNSAAVPTGDVFNSALGNVPDLDGKPATVDSMADAFNPYVSVATDTLTGTQFADTITIKDVAGKVAGTFVGGNVNAGAGNDTITGSKGDDVLTGNAGADSFVVTAGNDTVTDFALGSDTLTVTKGTGTAKVTVNFADKTSAIYNVTGNATTDVTIPALNADKTPLTKADLEKIAGVAPDTINWVDTAGVDDNKMGSAGNDTLDGAGGSDTLNGAAGNDILIGGKSADQLTGGTGSDTFVYKNTNESSVKFKSVDTITDFTSGTDKIDLSAIDADATATGDQAFAFTTAAFTNAAEVKLNGSVLEGHTAGHTTVDFTINLTGVTSVAATDFVL
ncbi:MAG: calcium-binding protein [Methylococcales bacterium]|nr:calcium-binding protein [Methylococcales bacterium]